MRIVQQTFVGKEYVTKKKCDFELKECLGRRLCFNITKHNFQEFRET